MEKCKRCQWHKDNLTVVYDVIMEMAMGMDHADLITDFELALCGSQGCNEPTRIYMDKHGDEIARKARLSLRRDMGIAEFTKTFPHWAKELATQDKAMYEAQ